MCSNYGKQEISFLFAKLFFGMNVKEQKNPSRERATKKAVKIIVGQPLNGN